MRETLGWEEGDAGGGRAELDALGRATWHEATMPDSDAAALGPASEVSELRLSGS